MKDVRYYEAHVCNIDADVLMGVQVPPYIVMDLTPNPVCLGEDVDWDLSGSYAPGSSVSSYAITFGDGNDDSGQSGSHTYGAAGTYTVTATIVSAAGLTQVQVDRLTVVDCSPAEPPLFFISIYSATDGSGVYYYEFE